MKNKSLRLHFDEGDSKLNTFLFNEILNGNDGMRRGPFGGALKKDIFVNESDYVVYEQRNVIYNKFDFRYNISLEKFKEMKSFAVEEGDFLLSGAGTIGKISRVPANNKKGIINQALIRIRINSKKVDSDYFLHWMRSEKMQHQLTSGNPGSAITNLVPLTEVKKWEISIPSLEEQKKIGGFLNKIDETLSLHQQELEALKQTKQGFLQKMFPRETETVPQIRFEGFSGEWKNNAFSTIVERVSQQSNSDSLPKLEFEDIISGEGRLNKDISEKFDNRKGIIFEPGCILFGKLRPYLKNWLLPKFNGIALGDFWVFTTKHSPEFVYSLIQTDKFQTVANLSTGTKMPRSDWKTVASTDFLIPSIEEQIKIGKFFRQLDEVIELKEKELEALKETKKGFLQKMFV